MPSRSRQSPVWSNGEVLDLISVWGEEAVQSQLCSSCRNYDTYGQISRAIIEKGYDQDAVQCRVKVRELRTAYHKVREANHHAGAAPTTCRFYKELDKILGGNSASTPKSTMDTSEAIAAHSSTRQEEESGSESAEEEGSPEPEDSPASLDTCSQELFSSQEEGSQLQCLGKNKQQRRCLDATLRSHPSLLSTAKRLQRIRKHPRRSKEDLLHEVMQQSLTENRKVHEWQETKRRLCQQNADHCHQSTERLLSIIEHQVDLMQVLIADGADLRPSSPPPSQPLSQNSFPCVPMSLPTHCPQHPVSYRHQLPLTPVA
ncbi:zinc finger and SCAN domain-containing protein 29-like [Gopherus flavomarginatus]|uniref:zinc finger and SCAN domain-containing protein 29-like n=1 Tax=Gopherus flavomarginatus TaxID=286002 RepID=UPI0021CC4CCB|nr:zinc finger and SCAN domain-containing protein 29-like [Gopherus flavomarginatus]